MIHIEVTCNSYNNISTSIEQNKKERSNIQFELTESRGGTDNLFAENDHLDHSNLTIAAGLQFLSSGHSFIGKLMSTTSTASFTLTVARSRLGDECRNVLCSKSSTEYCRQVLNVSPPSLSICLAWIIVVQCRGGLSLESE